MSSSPTLHVVTIGRNSLADLELTRASVVEQRYANLHHVLIDGASTDGSAERVMELAADGWTTAVSRPDRGIYDAMNSAFEFVDGGYVMFLHAGDTFVDGEAVERAMRAISAAPSPPDLAIGWSRFVSDGRELPYVVGGATPNAVTSAHESTIFAHAFHRHHRYDTELELAADYKFFRELARRDDLDILRLDFTISHFAFGGRSNDPTFDGARFLERARIDAGSGEIPTVLTYLRIAGRMAARRVVYRSLGPDRAARMFLGLACRRGNSGARRVPVGQVVIPSAG